MIYSLNKRGKYAHIPKHKSQPNTLRLRYYRALRGILKPMFTAILTRLKPILEHRLGWRTDAIGDDDNVKHLMGALRNHLLVGVKDVENVLTQFARDTSEFNARNLSSAMGFDVRNFAVGTRYMLDTFVEENISLIKSMGEDLLSDVQEEVNNTFAEGGRWEDLSDTLQERFSVTESRANLIARDQIGKLNGNFNERRQRDLGVEQYIWRSMGDERVRSEHKQRDGKIYAWSNPPSGGHPGEDFQCRCFADPVIPGLEAVA